MPQPCRAFPAEEADLDAALIETYAKAGITNDPLTHGSQRRQQLVIFTTLCCTWVEPARNLHSGCVNTPAVLLPEFSQQSNVNVNNSMVVFNIRDLEDELRPVAMYIVLNYIWNKTKSDKKRRLLIVDEAWQLMKYEDSANFIFHWPNAPVNITWTNNYHTGRRRFYGVTDGQGDCC
jgi:conjugal transfer ATP-binding protein TraC